MALSKKQRAAIALIPAAIRRVSFKDFGCVLHRTHKPVPNRVELHHRFPLYLQAQVWPDVEPSRPSTAHDTERVPACEGGHTDIHITINAILVGAPMPKGAGRAEVAEAQEALRRYKDAAA